MDYQPQVAVHVLVDLDEVVAASERPHRPLDSVEVVQSVDAGEVVPSEREVALLLLAPAHAGRYALAHHVVERLEVHAPLAHEVGVHAARYVNADDVGYDGIAER